MPSRHDFVEDVILYIVTCNARLFLKKSDKGIVKDVSGYIVEYVR
jgi:hypothetical protein